MAHKKTQPGIGSKVSFRDAYGNKHYGIIEDIIPDIMGGGSSLR